MFRKMRRSEKELSKEEVDFILNNAEYGTLAVLGEHGYPYSVPVNFAFIENKIVFHGAKAGYKFDLLKEEAKVSFSTVLTSEVVANEFDTLYKSVICFGIGKQIKEIHNKKNYAKALIEKYSKNYIDEGEQYIDRVIENTAVFAIDIVHITAKEGK